MKYGCCTTIENYSILEKLGYDFIELAGNQISAMTEEEFKKVKETITKGNIKCCGFNASLPPDIVIVGKDFDLEKARIYAKALCKRGSELGIKAIGIGSPNSRKFLEGDSLEKGWKQAIQFVTVFAEEAEPYSITILWEALNKTETNFGLRIGEGEKIIKAIGKENIKIVFDIYHLWMEKEPLQEVEKMMPYIRHIHIAERVGTERRYPSENLFKFYKDCLRIVLKGGYTGVISTEAFDGKVEEGATRSKKLLEKIVEELKEEGIV